MDLHNPVHKTISLVRALIPDVTGSAAARTPPPSPFPDLVSQLCAMHPHPSTTVCFSAFSAGHGTTTVLREIAGALEAGSMAHGRTLFVDMRTGPLALAALLPCRSPSKSTEPYPLFPGADLLAAVLHPHDKAGDVCAVLLPLVRKLADKYRLVLIDAPPIDDPASLAVLQAADLAVAVVAAERVHVKSAEYRFSKLKRLNCALHGVILNRQKRLVPEWVY